MIIDDAASMTLGEIVARLTAKGEEFAALQRPTA